MRILFFIDSLRAGGKERRLLELLKALKTTEFLCEVVVMNRNVQYQEIYELGIPLHFLIRRNKKDYRPFIEFYRICRRFKPDIVQSWSSMCTFYALPAILLQNIKLIVSQLTCSPGYVKPFSKRWLTNNTSFPFADLIVANSYEGLKDFHPPLSRSVCIHNGFDFNRLENLDGAEQLREKYDIRTPYIIGMIASFTKNKDYNTYITAAQIILKQRQDVTFLAIGDGPELVDRENQVLPDEKKYIKFVGKQAHVELFITICNIGVLSTYKEGISNAIMEFMVLGKPVIATDGGGTKELVVDHVTGFLMPPKSPTILVEKIQTLLGDASLCQHMGEAGRQRIVDEFSLDKMKADFVAHYRNLVAKQ